MGWLKKAALLAAVSLSSVAHAAPPPAAPGTCFSIGAFSGSPQLIQQMTRQKCSDRCAGLGGFTGYAIYFGVNPQTGGTPNTGFICACGTTATSSTVADSNCNTSCDGTVAIDQENCGGNTGEIHFAIGDVAPPANNPSSSAVVVPPPVSSTPADTLPNPPVANGYTLLGCFGTVGGQAAFVENRRGPDNSAFSCTAACRAAGQPIAGLFDNVCYCASALPATSTRRVPNSECSINCPGNPAEKCGGRGAPLARRQQVPADVRLVIYIREDGTSSVLTIPTPSSRPPTSPVSSPASSPTSPTIRPTGPTSGVSSPTPSPSTPALSNPGLVGAYALLGCYGSTSNFFSFVLSRRDGGNNVENCIAACGTSRYVGIYNTECYCGSALPTTNTRQLAITECNTRCPGNNTQRCGGLGNPLAKRQTGPVPAGVRLIIYVRIDGGPVSTLTSVSVSTGSGTTASFTFTSVITQAPTGSILSLPPGLYTSGAATPTGQFCRIITGSWVLGQTTLLPLPTGV